MLLLACNDHETLVQNKPDVQSKTEKASNAPKAITALTKNSKSSVHALSLRQINELQDLLDSFAQYCMIDDAIKGVSICFTDLESGKQFTINSAIKFVPASLLKIPVLIAIYKYEEENPGILNREIAHQSTHQIGLDHRLIENEAYKYQTNRRYTVQEYLTIMIRYSDNDATLSLLMFLNMEKPGFIERVEQDLNSSIPNSGNNTDDIVQVGHFSSQMKALYEASYLSLAHSEEALKLLSSSRYPEGFRKKLPPNLTIAHKFGVRFNATTHNQSYPVQLHQVALIYHTRGPFILTVMTKGKRIEDLRAVLQDAAALTYTYIDRLRD